SPFKGEFTLDKNLAEGKYMLRAYTNYMRNFGELFFYKRTFEIWDPYSKVENETSVSTKKESADFDVSFFPEGGDLVQNLSSRVAIKAVDNNGNSINVEGKIFDGNDQQVAIFKTIKLGMGFFSLSPSATTYYAEVVYNGKTKTFPLPKVKEKGYVLKVDSRKKDEVTVSVKTNVPDGLNQAFVLGHLRGNTFCTLEGQEGQMEFSGTVKTSELPDGIAHFTLFDLEGRPIAERLSFISNPQNKVNCQIDLSASSYGTREKVELDLQLTDNNNTGIAGISSISITDQSAVYTPENTQDIRTYLLLNSDLKGYIEEPAFYFKDESAGRRTVLDLLMMTQGWRRFKWEDLLEDQMPEIKYPLEKGFSLGGKVTKLSGNKGVKANVYISILENGFVMDNITTDESGEFLFLGLDFPDTSAIILQASKYEENTSSKKKKKNKTPADIGPGGKRNVDIRINPFLAPRANQDGSFTYPLPNQETLGEFFEDNQRMDVADANYNLWSIDLDAVVVKGRRKAAEPEELALANQTYKTPDHRLILDSVSNAQVATDIFQLIRGRYPGVRVQGTFPDQIITMRGVTGAGNEAALVIVDGVPVDADVVNFLNPNDVAVIDVLKGASAAFYGSRGINGILAIYTRKGAGMPPAESPSEGIINMKHPGYYQAREFYAPTYTKKNLDDPKPDYRPTLFWEPAIQLNNQGKASLSFFTADKTSTYNIIVEGITAEGLPFKKEKILLVE
ncbi:MAG: TonB-dependent receptor plug domain-containing protein, partial [Bacteroidota bacterium]